MDPATVGTALVGNHSKPEHAASFQSIDWYFYTFLFVKDV